MEDLKRTGRACGHFRRATGAVAGIKAHGITSAKITLISWRKRRALKTRGGILFI